MIHRTSRLLRKRPVCLLIGALAALAVWSTGCAAAGPGAELSVKPPPGQNLPESAGKTLQLPRDGHFTIHLAPVTQAPDLEGKTDAKAEANPDGSAWATATVDNGGTANATFQIGHAFQNSSDRQVDLKVTIRFNYEYRLELAPRGASPDTTVSLGLYARGGRNQLLRSQNLLAATTEVGDSDSKDAKELTLTMTLGPRENVSIFLAGNVTATTKPQRKTGGTLRLTGLQMDLATTPAPEVKIAVESKPSDKRAASKPAPTSAPGN